MTTGTHLIDSEGRLTLPREFANTAVRVERVGERELVIRAADDSPLPWPDEELPPLPHVRPLSDADRDLFLSLLDNPPPPNEALRRLMAGVGLPDVEVR